VSTDSTNRLLPETVPFWKRPVGIVLGVVFLVAILLGGSLVTSRGLIFGRSPVSADTPQFKTGDPNAVAAPGERLLQVSQPPTHTRTEIKLSKDLGKPVFAVKFQPYGLSSNGTAVIRIVDAVAHGGNQLAEQFAHSLVNQNLRATVALDSVAQLKAGGTYSGQLALVSKGGPSTFELSNATALK
jgi:hypothetical protein